MDATGVRHVGFVDERLLLVCDHDFVVIDIHTGMGQRFPMQREPGKPLAMWYLSDTRILLCYDHGAFFVNENGDDFTSLTNNSSRQLLFKWESRPEHVVRFHDYIVGFSTSFIEIREIFTVSGDLFSSRIIMQSLTRNTCVLQREIWYKLKQQVDVNSLSMMAQQFKLALLATSILIDSFYFS